MLKQATKKFDFTEAGGKVILYGISSWIKQTYFVVNNRDALLNI